MSMQASDSTLCPRDRCKMESRDKTNTGSFHDEHVEIKQETIETDLSHFETPNYTHCANTTVCSSHIKMEIGNAEKYLGDGYSLFQTIHNQNQTMDTDLKYKDPQSQRDYVKIKQETVESDQPYSENIVYKHFPEALADPSHIKMELDKKHSNFMYSGYQNQNIISENINQLEDTKYTHFLESTDLCYKHENVENDHSCLGNIDYTTSHIKMDADNNKRYLDNIFSNQMYVGNVNQKIISELKNMKQIATDSRFIKWERTDQNYSGYRCSRLQNINNEQENTALRPLNEEHEEQIHVSQSNTEAPTSVMKNNPNFVADKLTAEKKVVLINSVNSDLEADNSQLESSNVEVDNSSVKPERWVKECEISATINLKPTSAHQCSLFENPSVLRRHAGSHSTEQPHPGSVCDHKLKNSSDLQKHAGSQCTERPHQCSICDKKFKTSSNLKRHRLSHSNERPHQCSVCEKKFKTSCDLKRHTRSHSTERPHQCKLCDERFKFERDLRRHAISHRIKLPHQCNVCDKGFKTTFFLNRHMVTHSTERPHQCHVCDKGFKTAFVLNIHMTTHSTELPHQCNICNKRFKAVHNVRQHKRSHSSDRPHQCNVCDKEFKTLVHLRRHMISHSTDLPEKCNVCGKKFKTVFHLRSHMISHSTERPHQCNVCGKEYKSLSHLRNHMISHSTDRPHQCNVCDKEFKTVSDMRRHVIRHILKPPLPCSTSDKKNIG